MSGREIITVAQMREIDARAADLGAPTRLLMENAGAAVAREIQARWEPRPTVIFCGPGIVIRPSRIMLNPVALMIWRLLYTKGNGTWLYGSWYGQTTAPSCPC